MPTSHSPRQRMATEVYRIVEQAARDVLGVSADEYLETFSRRFAEKRKSGEEAARRYALGEAAELFAQKNGDEPSVTVPVLTVASIGSAEAAFRD